MQFGNLFFTKHLLGKVNRKHLSFKINTIFLLNINNKMSIYKNKVLYECGEAQFHKNVFVAHLLSHIFPPFALLLLSERQRKVHGFVYCYENPVRI